MKKLLLAFIFIPLFLGAQQTITSTIEHDGLIREYIIYIPAIYNDSAAVPLIINFHGFGSNDFEQMNYGDFSPKGDNLKTGSINKYENQIDISGLKPNIYFIKINNIAYKFLVVR